VPNNLVRHVKISEEPLPVCGPEIDVTVEMVESKLSTCHCEVDHAYSAIRAIEPSRLGSETGLTFFIIKRSKQCIMRMQLRGLGK